MKELILLPAMLCVCLLGGCNGDAAPAPDNSHGEQMAAGAAAVVVTDVALADCYSYTTGEDGKLDTWRPAEGSTLEQGDLVLVLSTEEKTAQVYVPGGDTPGLYGDVPVDALSQDPADIRQGNQANASGKIAYDGVDGQEAGTLNGMVEIVTREGDWYQVREIAGGNDQLYWIPADSLSFDLDSPVVAP